MEAVAAEVVNAVKDQAIAVANNIMTCKDYVEDLQVEMNRLKSIADDLKRAVQFLEDGGINETNSETRWWLNDVKVHEDKVKKIVYDYNKSEKCNPRLPCMPNLASRHSISSTAQGLLKAVDKLASNTPKDLVTEAAPERSLTRKGGESVGMEPALEKLKAYFKDEGTSIIGIYGMGGVGKTLLMEKFNNECHLVSDCFGIWIDMGSHPTTKDIQKMIIERLGYSWSKIDERRQSQSVVKRALSNRKFVLYLDDMWEPVDLHGVGIPTSHLKPPSKIIFTTQMDGVFTKQLADAKRVCLDPLSRAHAEILLSKMTGTDPNTRDPQLKQCWDKLLQRFGGLPRAITTIGNSLKSPKPPVWKDVDLLLSDPPKDIGGAEKEFLLHMKPSYDRLPDDLKPCFLCACMISKDGSSKLKDVVIDHFIGEGLMNRQFDRWEQAHNYGIRCLDELRRASFVEDGESNKYIRVHPMLRVLALWIGNTDRKWLVRMNEPTYALSPNKWKQAGKISLACNNIPNLIEGPACPSLSTLLLPSNNLKFISEGFFNQMKVLKVLDLSDNPIEELPAGIKALHHLRHLDIRGTEITRLPVELSELLGLRFFFLSRTSRLLEIPVGLIMKLKNLQIFFMDDSFKDWRVSGSVGGLVDIEELEKLSQLKAFGITVRSKAALERPKETDRLKTSLRRLSIVQCKSLKTLSPIHIAEPYQNLRYLRISKCESLENVTFCNQVDKVDTKFTLPELEEIILESLPKALVTWTKNCLQNLFKLGIYYCNAVEHLALCVEEADDIAGGATKVLADEVAKGEGAPPAEEFTLFPNLHQLQLFSNNNLKSLHNGRRRLVFPRLEVLEVRDCLELKNITVDAPNIREIYGSQSWWNKLEDEATKKKFLPFFKKYN